MSSVVLAGSAMDSAPGASAAGSLFPGGRLPRGVTVVLGPPAAGDRQLGSAAQSGSPAAGDRQLGSAAQSGSPAQSGLTSLLLLLLAGASASGSWCAVVGFPDLGLAAATELGVDLGRLVLVPDPGGEGRWQSVVATLLESLEVVCLGPVVTARPVRQSDARRLAARSRERGSTLVVVDRCDGRHSLAHWPGGAELHAEVTGSSWSGLGRGHGLLGSRRLEVEIRGRGAASRPRRELLEMPA